MGLIRMCWVEVKHVENHTRKGSASGVQVKEMAYGTAELR